MDPLQELSRQLSVPAKGPREIRETVPWLCQDPGSNCPDFNVYEI